MALRTKVLLILLSVYLVYGATSYVVYRHQVHPSFSLLEREEAADNISRCVAALDREIHHLDLICSELATRAEPGDSFSAAHSVMQDLDLSFCMHNEISLVHVRDVSDETLFSRCYDLRKGKQVSLRILYDRDQRRTYSHLTGTNDGQPFRGIMVTERGPMLFAAWPIRPEGKQGPALGTLVLGRFFQDGVLDALRRQTQPGLEVLPIGPQSLAEVEAAVTTGLPLVRPLDKHQLRVATFYNDFLGAPALMLRLDLPRRIMARGIASMAFAMVSHLAAGFVIFFGLMLTLRKMVTRPISQLSLHAAGVRSGRDLSARVTLNQTDEIGELGRRINHMLELLEKADREREDRLRQLRVTNEKLVHEMAERRRLERELLELNESEHRRIGQDLHDGLGQHLTGIAFKSSVLEQDLRERKASEAALAEEITTLLNEAIDQTRGIARGLFPVELPKNGLVSSLKELALNLQEIFDIHCMVEADPNVHLNDSSAVMQLFRIAQEAARNAARHSGADRIEIRVTQSINDVTLTVRDNGCGLSDIVNEFEGMGLRIMNHRAGIIGASLEIQNHPDGGTQVMCKYRNEEDSDSEGVHQHG